MQLPKIIIQLWKDASGWRWNAPEQGLHSYGFKSRDYAVIHACALLDPFNEAEIQEVDI